MISAQRTVQLLLQAWAEGTGVKVLSAGGRMLLSGRKNEVPVEALGLQPPARRTPMQLAFWGGPGQIMQPYGQAQGLLSRLTGGNRPLGGARDTPQTILMLFPPKQPNARY